MKDSGEFCGELSRHSGSEDASRWSLRGLIAAGATLWALRLAIVALVGIAGGCAHTDIKRGPDDCGTFSSWDHGLGLVVPTAGQYERYALACGTERFSRVVANQRMAVVAGARAAVNGGRDAVAREEIARTQRDLHGLAADVVAIGDAVTGQGGAK